LAEFDIVLFVALLLPIACLAYFLGWLANPWNSALARRVLTKKNWIVMLIRASGGQLRDVSVEQEGPTVSLNNKTYLPREAFAAYRGSVPTYVFPRDDIKPTDLRAKAAEASVAGITDEAEREKRLKEYSAQIEPLDISQREKAEEAFRNPEHLNSVIMLIKAIAEAKALLQKNWIVWLVVAVILIEVFIAFVEYLVFGEIQQLRAQLGANVTMMGQGLTNAVGI
jgi:hypothetical protein